MEAPSLSLSSCLCVAGWESERGETLNKFLIGLRTLNFKEEHRLFILKDFKKFLGDGLSKTFWSQNFYQSPYKWLEKKVH